MRGIRGLVGVLACAVVVTSVVAVPAGTAAEDREVLIDTATEGLYNAALGTRLDGTQTHRGQHVRGLAGWVSDAQE